jgi:hypothetical protein
MPFSPRRRTAVVLSGEGTGAAYLVGAMKALDAAGVRVDVVLGRGAGALVAAFSALCAEDKIDGDGGLLGEVLRRRPYRLSRFYRFVALCLAASFAFFAAPALVGIASVVLLPVQALVRGLFPDSDVGRTSWLSSLIAAVEPYYLPAVAFPLIVLFLVFTFLWLRRVWNTRGRRPDLSDLFPPLFDLEPLEGMLAASLWQLAKGTASRERPPGRHALSQAYVQLLTAGLGQTGFREIVIYALDTDTGAEIPFVVLKDRFAGKLASSLDGTLVEPIDLAADGGALFFDAVLAALTPPGLAPEVGMKLPRAAKLGGEVHRFVSSLASGAGVLAQAVAAGAEQIFYVTSVPAGGRVSGSLWERMATGAARAGLERDLQALESLAPNGEVPVFVVRPESERLAPFELEGRPQVGGGRLFPSALVDQGARDVERLFVRPVLGEELAPAPREASTVKVDRDWERGPKEL